MERCECLLLNSKFAQKSGLVKTKPFNRQTVISDNQLFRVLSTGVNTCPQPVSLGRHWSMALSMTLCLNSAQTEISRYSGLARFCKVVWQRYLGKVKSWTILSHFVANLSKTLHINFYQIWSSNDKYCRSYDKKTLVCFLCPTVYILIMSCTVLYLSDMNGCVCESWFVAVKWGLIFIFK